MARDDSAEQHDEHLPSDWPEQQPGTFAAGRARQLVNVRDVQFPMVLRGYDRESVDRYVERVNHVIAELEARSSPETAVKRALERVGEETTAILQRANDSAEQITRRSRAQADDRLRSAEREAADMREAAEARLREVDQEIQALWRERQRLIDEARHAAHQLLEVADEAGEREPPATPGLEAEDTGRIEAMPAGAEAAAAAEMPEEEELVAAGPEGDEPAFGEDATVGEESFEEEAVEEEEAALEQEPAAEGQPAFDVADEDGQPGGEEIAGHPELEPEPPERELPDEGIIRVEPIDRGNERRGS